MAFRHRTGLEGHCVPCTAVVIGVAISSQCPYRIQVHVANAKETGATKAQTAEATMIAGAAVTHGTLAFRISDEAPGS